MRRKAEETKKTREAAKKTEEKRKRRGTLTIWAPFRGFRLTSGSFWLAIRGHTKHTKRMSIVYNAVQTTVTSISLFHCPPIGLQWTLYRLFLNFIQFH